MTLRKQAILDHQLSLLLREPGNYPVSLSIFPVHKYRGGHKISISASTRIEFDPPHGKEHVHFIGMHGCLCLTTRRPIQLNSLLRMSKEVHEIEPFGRVIWLGTVTIQDDKNRNNQYVYVPLTIWRPPRFSGGFRTKGIVHSFKIRSGKTRYGYEYGMLSIPAIQGEHLLPSYLEASGG